jgi:predicted unusual protein kinase regulating ubiquinone biosynthesis (AarF/ABC1/UbiB family)
VSDGSREIPSGRIRRTIPLASLTARALGASVVAAARERAGDDGARARFHARTAEHYVDLLGHSRGLVMKAGQFLSMLDAHAIGTGQFAPYQAALRRLQTQATPMTTVAVIDTVQYEFGSAVEDLFQDFNYTPCAAASIGQVHRAKLHDGRAVAVKIQYPGVAQAVLDDLANVELLTAFFRFAFSAAGGFLAPDFAAAAGEVGARLAEELDYLQEARNIAAFAELYRDHPFIRVPDVVPEASSSRVLTMTFLDGVGWAEAQEAPKDLKDRWGETIQRFVLGSFKHSNLFHADPHPSNYRFRPDGSVGFVDFGCIKVLPEAQRHGFVAMVRAAIEYRKEDMRERMIEIGFLPRDSGLSADAAHKLMEDLVHECVVDQPVTYESATTTRAIRSMLDIRAGDHPVRQMKLPDDFVFLTRINLSMNAICARLNATIHARAVTDDLDGVSAPTTALGREHHAWRCQRGLPLGLDRRGDL